MLYVSKGLAGFFIGLVICWYCNAGDMVWGARFLAYVRGIYFVGGLLIHSLSFYLLLLSFFFFSTVGSLREVLG